MRSVVDVERVRRLLAEGHNDCEVSRRTGIRGRRSAIGGGAAEAERRRAWLRASPAAGAPEVRLTQRATRICSASTHLGDGYIVAHPRADRLRIFLDVRYPQIIAEAVRATEVVAPAKVVSIVPGEGRVAVSAYWKHWPCVFPQHGPGRKHERAIVLEPWQREIADAHPGELVRGLIHSDGWRGTNRVTVRGRRYAYPRYTFDNRSDGIRAISCAACDALGVEWRRMGATTISVARRASVARLDEFVGPKR